MPATVCLVRNNMRRFQINENDGGQRLDKFVLKTVKGLPSSLLYKYLRLKKIKLNGKRAEGKQMLQAGDEVVMYIPEEFFEEKTGAQAELLRMKPRLTVVYEDENILLCDKAPGVLAHTGDREEAHAKELSERDTLIYHVMAYLCQKGEYDPSAEHSFAPALCNRIDRNTGGLVIAAKNAQALREMNEHIRENRLEKEYLCAVHGKMSAREETLRGYLFKDSKTKTVTVRSHKTTGAREIITKYKTLAYSPEHDLSLLGVTLVTGRTHQIRAHMASIAHPLLGEGKYGVNRGDRALGYAHQALYAYRLRFHIREGLLSYLDGRSFTVNADHIRFLSLFGDKGAAVALL